jgi:hypothetical protein
VFNKVIKIREDIEWRLELFLEVLNFQTTLKLGEK